MTRIQAATALLPDGWARDVAIDIDASGRIAAVTADAPGSAVGIGGAGISGAEILLPALPNLHSHTFQRAMAGLTERREPSRKDTFWTWRDTMYRFVDELGPEDVECIAALAFMEMLESGFGSVAEFHYLHHQRDGRPYDNPTELGDRIVAAAQRAGIGLTLLPVFYAQSGVQGGALAGGQLRFGNDLDAYQRLLETQMTRLVGGDTNIGVAPHSLRAVPLSQFSVLTALAPEAPLHIHAAEQRAEVEALRTATGARPVEWLLDEAGVDARWCIVHATHMTPSETTRLAERGAVAGLCPETEANLGDGVFNGVSFVGAGGRFGVGTDSNVRIDAPGELRQFEYSQRLRHQERVLIAEPDGSAGERLYGSALEGGAQALGRDCGRIEVGLWADLVSIDLTDHGLTHLQEGGVLDAWIFAAGRPVVRDVWSAGRHCVKDGRHVERESISQAYASCMARLVERV